MKKFLFQKVTRRILIIVLMPIVILVGGYGAKDYVDQKIKEKIKFNVILLGWDGVEPDRLQKLLNENKLPNFVKYFKEGGSCVDAKITTTTTETLPGWVEILTGYNGEILGTISNDDYRPLPEGYTIFERLQQQFGKENIETFFVTGRVHNLGSRGPHKICTNCTRRNAVIREKKYRWWDVVNPDALTTRDGLAPVLEEREGEPYMNTRKNLTFYVEGLDKNKEVSANAHSLIDIYKDRRFFLFAHNPEPDEQGHEYGEDSQAYLDAIVSNDKKLGELIDKLKNAGIYNKTKLFITTDHGMDRGTQQHHNAPNIFICSSEKGLKGPADRKDMTPTILKAYGVDLSKIDPPLDGKPLY